MTTATLPQLKTPTPATPAHASRWHPDGWCFRGVVTALALASSGTYAVALLGEFGRLGVALLVGAALAWPALLAAMWLASEPAWRLARLDWCLWTRTVGSVFMTLGFFVVTLLKLPAATLLVALAIADLAMGWVLTRYAPTVGVPRPTALLIWTAGMNGFLLGTIGLYLTAHRFF